MYAAYWLLLLLRLQAADPSSTFPEAPLDCPEQLRAVADNQGPAGSGQGLKVSSTGQVVHSSVAYVCV